MGYKVIVDNKGSAYSFADDQKKKVFHIPENNKQFQMYLNDSLNRKAEYTFQFRAFEAKMDHEPGKEFEEFLRLNPTERLKCEHCKSAEELKLVIDGLRARGLLQGSVGISHFMNAIIDEANIADRQVLDGQNKPYAIPSTRQAPTPDK